MRMPLELCAGLLFLLIFRTHDIRGSVTKPESDYASSKILGGWFSSEDSCQSCQRH